MAAVCESRSRAAARCSGTWAECAEGRSDVGATSGGMAAVGESRLRTAAHCTGIGAECAEGSSDGGAEWLQYVSRAHVLRRVALAPGREEVAVSSHLSRSSLGGGNRRRSRS